MLDAFVDLALVGLDGSSWRQLQPSVVGRGAFRISQQRGLHVYRDRKLHFEAKFTEDDLRLT